MKRIFGISLALALALSSLTGCGDKNASSGDSQGSTSDSNEGTVKVAVYAPLTGDHAEYGTSFKVAAEIQADRWNAKGGAHGMKVEIVSYDDKSSGEEAAAIAERVVEDPDVMGIIGSYVSGVSMA